MAVILTAQEALHALADGEILVNDDGMDVKLDSGNIVLSYEAGRNGTVVTQTYNGSYNGLSRPEAGE